MHEYNLTFQPKLCWSFSVSCNFDSGLCYGWHQSQLSDVFNWTRGTGGTPSFNTGPSSDHTTGSGQITFYLFIRVALGELR